MTNAEEVALLRAIALRYWSQSEWRDPAIAPAPTWRFRGHVVHGDNAADIVETYANKVHGECP